MRLETRDSLLDIAEAGRRISSYTAGMTGATFLASEIVLDAVKWNFLVIGEALNAARKSDEATVARVSDWSRIIAFRHQLAHGYDQIDDEIVWRIIETKLPILLSEIAALLSEPAS